MGASVGASVEASVGAWVGASVFSFFARAPLGKQNGSEIAKVLNVLSQILLA